MNNQQKMALVMEVFNMIFASKGMLTNEQWAQTQIAGFEQSVIRWDPRAFVNGTVRGADVDINAGGKMLALRFMEQNPNKTDKNGQLKQTASRARSGERIMWVIDRNQQVNAFLGSVQNGQWVASQMRAYQPAKANPQYVQASPTGFSTGAIPNIPVHTTIPEYVVQTGDPTPPVMDDMGGFDPDAYEGEDHYGYDGEPY